MNSLQWSGLVALGLACLNAWSAPGPAQPHDIIIRLRERVPMEQLAEGVINPASSRYNKFYTPEEIRKISGPTQQEHDELAMEAKARGFTIIAEDKTGLFITLRPPSIAGPTSNFVSPPHFQNSIFSSQLVENIATVDRLRLHSYLRISPHELSGQPTTPDQVRSYYGFNGIYNQGLTGSHQHVAIATYYGFNHSDISDYFKKTGVKVPPVVDQVIFNGVPKLDINAAEETEADIELLGQIAPGSNIHVFSSAENNGFGELQTFLAILDDNRSQVVNYSWGTCEINVSGAHLADMNKVFSRAVAQGVNIFVASGDNGAIGCSRMPHVVADFPSSHPFVVSVGGTTLTTTAADGDETAWEGSGGGVSLVFNLPSWQQNFNGAFVRRSIPDVAFNADPRSGQPVWIHVPPDPREALVPPPIPGVPLSPSKMNPRWVMMGGTSIASPQWAGFMALVNEARGAKGPMGFLNPVIYGLNPQQRGFYFNDVLTGDNHAYHAGQGWDAVTGWGSMKAWPLLDFLSR